MLKRITIKKICISISALVALLLIYLIPSNNIDLKEEVEYVDSKLDATDIFLIDKNSYLALTKVPVNETDIVAKAKELIKILTVGGMESKLPSGFSAIIPSDTEVLSVDFDSNILKINFSKDILDIDKKLEEKMIESIVYTLTSIDKVKGIIIYVEGDVLTKLPKTKINLPSTLDRSFGINKEFNLTSTSNITDVTVYYINQINDNYYYVPVTKYLNDDRDKISIIVEELASGFNRKLISYMNEDVKVVSQIVDNNSVKLELENMEEFKSDKIIDTLSLSICDNYNVENVKLNENEKACKKA